jgi:cobalt-zinc-cadmium efflux system outer membrane protein
MSHLMKCTVPLLALALCTAATAQQQTPQAVNDTATYTPGSTKLTNSPFSPNALTLAQVIDAAKTKNPTLLAAARNVDAVRAQEKQAAVRQNPIFGLNANDFTEHAEGDANPYTYAVQFSRLFERGDKRHWRIENAKATTEQTNAQYLDQQRQVIFNLKQAFTAMLMAKAILKFTQDDLKEFRHELEINRDRLDAGDISKLDYERLDLQLSQFESDEANARVSVAQASLQLQTLMGVSQPSTDNGVFDIQGEIVPPVIATDLATLTQTALATRPDYLAAQAAVRAADANVRLQIANGTADPTLEAEYDRVGTDNSASASINIPLRLFDRNQGNKETARFTSQANVFLRDAAANQVRSDVAQAWVGYTVAKSLSDRYATHYLDESQDILQISQFAYEHGGLALIDYLDAIRDARTEDYSAVQAYNATWLAIHQLSLTSASEVVP